MTVNKAILRGHLVVNVPVLIIMIGTGFVFVGITNTYDLPQGFPLIGFVLGFVLAWLYWSFSITKWKIWAFEKVRNVHELKSRAILEGLIWSDNHAFGKTEIWSGSEKDKWNSIKEKFKKADVFEDDESISIETKIKYTKSNLYSVLLLTIIGIVGGIYFLLYKNDFIIGVILVSLGIIVFPFILKKIIATEPSFIIINSNGVQTPETKFLSWSYIKNEKIIKQNFGKNTKFYFTFTWKGSREKIDIDKLDIDVNELHNLLKIYRGRNNIIKTTANNV